MIAGATRGTGGPALARHLLKVADGQIVEVMPSRNLAADNLKDQLRELVAVAARGRTSRPVHHLHIDPPPGVTNPEAIIQSFIRHYEHEFGLVDASRCGVFHMKSGRKHAHVVWSLVREDGSVVSLAHDHARREKISRIVEFEHSLPLTRGKHNRSAAAALWTEGREDVAEAMEAAGLLGGNRAIAHSTPRERAQAERTKVPLEEIRNRAFAAWQASDNSRELAVMLHSFDFSIAQGSRGLVIVDRSGATHSLNRVLAAAARHAGADRITAAAVRKRLGGITFPSVEEIQNGRHAERSSEESGRSNLLRGEMRSPDVAGTVALVETAPGGRRRDAESAGRIEGIADCDRGDSPQSKRNPETPRCRLQRRAAVVRLEDLDLAGLTARARRLAAGEDQGDSERSSLVEGNMTRGSDDGGKIDFKRKLLSQIAPQGFDVEPFAADLRMIQVPSPSQPTTKILLIDGGWVEVDSQARIVRVWGKPGRARILAAALADAGGWHVEELKHIATVVRKAAALRVIRKTENPVTDLVAWWQERGYVATAAPDGTWVHVGAARIRDMGDLMEVHGPVSGDVAVAIITKAKEAWDGGVYLHGHWTQVEQDMVWLEAQRQGVEVQNCEPSAVAREVWRKEQAKTVRRVETMGKVRSAVQDAADLLAGARGNHDALLRLPNDLRVFVVSYLDDDQRAELAAFDVVNVIPELERFRKLGEAELAEMKRKGKPQPTILVPEPTPEPDDSLAPKPD